MNIIITIMLGLVVKWVEVSDVTIEEPCNCLENAATKKTCVLYGKLYRVTAAVISGLLLYELL